MARRKKTEEIDEIIRGLTDSDDYEDQAVFVKNFPGRKARYATLKPPVDGPLRKNLEKLGLEKLYTHQEEAVRLVRDGEDIVIATETASGKTLGYNIPVIENAWKEPSARALYLFPTKALGQDQAKVIHNLVAPGDAFEDGKYLYSLKYGRRKFVFGTYDGDTPRQLRPDLRRDAAILLTNPDMLSLGILPNHARLWGRFFQNLRYVVIDEIHTYRGVFGSHVANLMRRLVRICEYYGARPQFICCSATISNPGEHAGRLVGRDVREITASGAPTAGRTFVMWNPPTYDEGGETRRSPLTETINLFRYFVESGKRTIVFARAKPTVEVILQATREKLAGGPVRPDRIVSYRAGYLPEDRRAIERALSRGELLGVACTSALELGVDIGSLDSAVINGYPGSISSVWQQAGRAGRRESRAIAVFVAYAEPLDQYFMRHPEYFFGRPVEQAIINPGNEYILSRHLDAASAELPLRRSEEPLFGGEYVEIVRDKVVEGKMREQRGGVYWVGDDYPASEINLRAASADRYSIMLPDGTIIGEMDASTVQQYLHDGAIYLHQAQTYIVESLDFERRAAVIRPAVVDYFTRSLSSEDVAIDRELRKKKIGKTRFHFGYLNVDSRVHSYKKIRRRDEKVLGWEELNYPEERLWTQGLWFIPPDTIRRKIDDAGLDLMGGLHAVEHATIAMAPFLAMCDRDDIGGLSTDMHPDIGSRPVIFIHDAHEGGIGLAESCYHRIRELLYTTLDLVSGCPCRDGCPSCIQSPKCGNMNEPLDKRAALLILEEILGKKKKRPSRKK